MYWRDTVFKEAVLGLQVNKSILTSIIVLNFLKVKILDCDEILLNITKIRSYRFHNSMGNSVTDSYC